MQTTKQPSARRVKSEVLTRLRQWPGLQGVDMPWAWSKSMGRELILIYGATIDVAWSQAMGSNAREVTFRLKLAVSVEGKGNTQEQTSERCDALMDEVEACLLADVTLGGLAREVLVSQTAWVEEPTPTGHEVECQADLVVTCRMPGRR